MKIYEIATGYTPVPAVIAAATESIVEELTKAFMDMEQEVEILDVSTKNRAENMLPITEVKCPSLITQSDVQLGIMHKLKRVTYSVCLAFKLKKILKKTQEKIVLHFHNQYNMFFFLKIVPEKLRKKAIIAYTNHNGWWSLPWNESKEILTKRYFQEIESMQQADIVFVLNERMKNTVCEGLKISPEKVIKIDNGVNVDIYYPLEKSEKESLKKRFSIEDKELILQVGSVNENKGQKRAIELLLPILKNNPSVVYGFAGEIVSGEYYQQVLDFANENDVENQVIYLGGFAPGKEMNEVYNMATATIFLSKYESFGLVCVESISSGVPVFVLSDLLLNFGQGSVLFSKDNFEKNFTDYFENKDTEKENLSVKGRENAIENYTWKSIATQYKDTFEKFSKK